MVTIKGGVTILPKSDNVEFMTKLKDAGVAVKMPFTATGFTSTKTPKIMDLIDIKSKEDIKVKPVKSVKVKGTKKKSILNKLKKMK
jgi:hypothetical protein